jgi:CRISPR/Cas system-associated endonuclease Cas1
MMDLYRFLVEDWLIQRYSKIREKDFVMKFEFLSRKKIGAREYLNDLDSKGLMRELNRFFESTVDIPRMRVGKRQTLETLISEEAQLLAKYLRNERKDWTPRIPTI